MVPVYVAVTRPGQDVGWLDVVAVVVGLASVALDLVADLQMYRFARNRSPVRRWTKACGSGRGTPTTSASSASGSPSASSGSRPRPRTRGGCWSGAVAILALFLGASIPMMEKRSLERRPEYQDVSTGCRVCAPPAGLVAIRQWPR